MVGAAFGLLLVLGGVAAGVVTFLAGQAGDAQLAYYGSIACLASVILIALFVVPPLARAARTEVRLIKFPVRLTAGGLAFLMVLAGVAFAAWNTGNNMLFLIFAVMVSTIFVQWAAARVVLRDTGLTVRYPEHVFAGEVVTVAATLHNLKRVLPSIFVLLESRERDLTFGARVSAAGASAAAKGARRLRMTATSQTPFAVRHQLARFEYVGRGAKVEQRAERSFTGRGEVVIENFTLTTLFPFGIFESRRRLRTREVHLVIYPVLEPVRARFNLPPLKGYGEAQTPRRGQSAELFGLRDYQAGDDRRHIDWKATARTRRLTVREFAADAPHRVRIALDRERDTTAETETWAARFERGVTLAASLAAHFTRQGGEVALTIDDAAAPARYGDSQAHLYELLRRLALTAPDATPHAAASTASLRFHPLAAQAATENAHLILVTATRARHTLPHTAHVIGY